MGRETRIRLHESSFTFGDHSYCVRRYERDEGDSFTAFGVAFGPASAAAFGPASAAAFGAARSSAHEGLPARPLVFLHGFAQSAATWDDVIRRLLDGERSGVGPVYALDFLGHGGSERAVDAQAYGMDEACASLAAFLDWVTRREAARPVLVGYSMGGRIALETLVRSADGCRGLPLSGLVLESAGFGPSTQDDRRSLEERNAAWALIARERGIDAFIDHWEQLPIFSSQLQLPEYARRAVREERLSNDAEALARTLEGMGAHRQADAAVTLSALERAMRGGLPVLYVTGALDDKYSSLARGVSGEVHVVEDAGHNVHLEQPEAFVDILADWISRF